MTLKQMLMLGAAAGGLCVAVPFAQLDAQAFNATPKTVVGGVTYDRATPGVETVFIDTDSAIINWTPTAGVFLPAGNRATFSTGPNNTNFAVLNRIITTTPIVFNGTVLSRIQNLAAGTSDPGGTVIFSSPGGIVVGSTAVFDVGNLILTSLNVADNSGDFGGTTGNYQFADGAAFPNAAIITNPGSQITALNQGSYVAMIAPRVIHGGALRIDGSAAYVAGEALELRVNNGLFDIIVTSGSANATPLIHTGTTGGPASAALDDVQRIYMVAVPKNQAITAILEGNVGFDPAVMAGVENGAIVLSAGHSIVGGNVDRFANGSPAPSAQAASFHIRGGTITSDLTGVAVTDMLASGQTTGSLTFQQDVSLFADRRAHLFAGQNQTVTVAGNALSSAARFNSADTNATDLTGGEALVFAQAGGSVTINGATTVTAVAQGRSNTGGVVGSGTGGTAGIFVDQGNVQLNGDVVVDASGFGAVPPVGSPVGGNGTGGTAFVEGRNGGTVTITGSLGVNGSGAASEASGMLAMTGMSGLGGTIRLGTTGQARVTVNGPTNVAADGRGGTVFDGPGNDGGLGRGGTILVTQTGGLITLNGGTGMSANGFGGAGPDGGIGQGGTITFDVTNAQLHLVGGGALAAVGTGGDSIAVGGLGGNGLGGTVRMTARTGGGGSRIDGGAVDVAVTGTGGTGGGFMAGNPAGDGGDGQGGDIVLAAEAGNAVLDLGALTGSADGQGGRGGGADNNFGGGDGGDGRGGTITVGTTPTAAPAVTGNARFASVDLHANGLGGNGGLGRGTGGNAFGGSATLSANGAPVTIAGATTLASSGVGGTGGVDPTGGGPGDDGQATGGGVTLAANGANGTLNAGTVDGTASVTGAATATNTPGHWHVTAGAGGAVNLTNLNLIAAANGTIGAAAFSSLEPLGGTIGVTGIANLTTPGEIRVLASGAGRVSGGRYNLTAGTDVTMSHAAPAVGGVTIDATDLFIVSGDDISADAGVVTRTSAQTDIRATDAASIAGRIEGNAILLRSASLDLAGSGAIGTAATAAADVQATGNVSVAGRIDGRAIIVRASGLDVTATGGIGTAATVTTDVRATGNASVAGQIQGQAIVLRSAALDVGAAGLVGGAGTNSTDILATGAATVAGRIDGQAIVFRSAGLDIMTAGQIGTATTATNDVRATGNASVAGQIQGQAIVLRSAALDVGAAGLVGGAGTNSTDILATGAATVAGQIGGGSILLNAASLDQAATGVIGTAATFSTEVQLAGNANVAGRIDGQAIVLRSAGLDIMTTGGIGTAATATNDVRATGNASVAGRIEGQAIVLRSAGLNVGAAGVVGGTGTNSTDILATGAATVAGQIGGRSILLNAASLDQAATGVIGNGAATDLTDIRTGGTAAFAGQVTGAIVRVNAAAISVAPTGMVGGGATTDVRSSGNAAVAGQIQGQAIVLRSAGLTIAANGAVGGAGTNSTDILATGAATVAGQIGGRSILLNAASLDQAATGVIGNGASTDLADVRTAGNATFAGQVTGTNVRVNAAAISVAPTGTVGGAPTAQAELRATGAIGVGGRVLGTNILLASSDVDLPAGGAIGDAATARVTLQPNATGLTAVLGGTTQGPGYTLGAAEAGRIRAGTLRIDAPAVVGGNALLIRDVTFNGGGAAAGIGTLEIDSPGVTRIEGALAMANAAADNGISISSRERVEVVVPAGSIRVRSATGTPGGGLQLQSNNIWIASAGIIDRLRANPNHAGRDADLLDNGGNEAERGFVEADRIVLASGGTLYAQNTGPAFSPAYAGITNGPGGLVIRATAPGVSVNAFGRRLNGDGTFNVGDAWFFLATYQAGGAAGAPGSFAPGAAFNTCIIPTGQCAARPPADPVPGRDPTTGPTGGSESILLPPGADADDLVDTSFAAEGLIEEPVTSGGDNSLWETDCDRDNDGDCDEGGR